MGGTDDRRLLEQVAAGDARAFEAFVRRWEGPLYRFLSRVTGSAALAEDARQLTLFRVYTRAGTYQGGAVRVWLFRVAYRVGLNVRRSESRAAVDPLGEADRAHPGQPGPAEGAALLEERDRVRRALGRMEESDRALLWLRVAEDLTFDELAAVLDAPPTTLRYRFTRALGRMRSELRPAVARQERAGC